VTAARRDWLPTFADEAVLSDLEAALRSMAGELDDCNPEECMHPEQRIHPFEVYVWVVRELHMAQQRPSRLEPAGRPNRKRDGDTRMSLAIAG
jgi:hypothetical protein